MDMGTQTGAGVSMETSKHTRTQCQALVEQQVPEVSRGALSPRSVATRCCYTALQLFEVQKADSGLVLMPWMIQSRGFKVSKSMGINVVHFTSQANWKHFKKRTWWKSDSAAKCWGGWANTGQTSRTQNCLFGKEKLEQPLGASTAHQGRAVPGSILLPWGQRRWQSVSKADCKVGQAQNEQQRLLPSSPPPRPPYFHRMCTDSYNKDGFWQSYIWPAWWWWSQTTWEGQAAGKQAEVFPSNMMETGLKSRVLFDNSAHRI